MATDERPRDERGSREHRDDDPREDMPNGRDLSEARRRGLPERGFDAGTGYGGAGGASAYSGKSSYGGQSGLGGNRMHGAYAGEPYGRTDTQPAVRETVREEELALERAVRAEERVAERASGRHRRDERDERDDARSGVPGRDTGRGGTDDESASAAPPGVDLPRGTDEHPPADRQASEERIADRDARRIVDGWDADGPIGGERRDELH